MTISLKLGTHRAVGGAGILRSAVAETEDDPATLHMAEETVAEAGTEMGTLDQAGNVGKHELTAIDRNHTELGMQRREGIVGYLRLRGAHRRQQGGLPCVR